MKQGKTGLTKVSLFFATAVLWFWAVIVMAAAAQSGTGAACPKPNSEQPMAAPLPCVKQWHPGGEKICLTGVTVLSPADNLQNEIQILSELLQDRSISLGEGLLPLHIRIVPLSFPQTDSAYQHQIKSKLIHRLCR